MASEKSIRWAKAAVLLAAAAVLIVAISFSGLKRAGSVQAESGRKPLPDFRLSDLSGTAWRLSDHRGEVVLLNFWATWCGACVYETPDLVKVAHRYSGRGLVMLGISMDEDAPATVPEFIQKYRIPYQVVIADSSFDLASQIEALPTTVLLDKQGRVAKSWVGAVDQSELTPILEELLNEKV